MYKFTVTHLHTFLKAMPSPICHCVINLVVGLPVRRDPGVLKECFGAGTWSSYQLDFFFDVAKFTTLTSLSLVSSCRLKLPVAGLKVFSIPTFALEYPNRIFICYLGK